MTKFLNQIEIQYGRLLTPGNAGRKALNQNSGDENQLSDTDILIRESIQNSTDSAIGGRYTNIKLRSLTLTSELNENYNEELGIRNFLKPKLKAANYDFTDSKDLNNILFIEDYQTWGLTESEKM